ncbi:MAG: c-type cytochrome [Candidatus Anammoximicrobium sp.]|nr:c-type cytochrome [Candidatus Anammoximicrobium sp.]
MKRLLFWVTVCVLTNLSSYSAGRVAAAEIQLASDAPGPLAPDESRKRFQLAPGFRIELVAAEPHVADPVAMDFDARGRIFVCELHGYNLEGYLDVQELNKTGVLDTAVRRIPANPEAIKRAEEEQYGTVKLLEDTDGDGRVDRSHVWADRLPACYGVVAARDGVIALCAPDIIFLADRDGDGLAEVRQTLFSGFGLYDMWSRISNPRRGVDNWIYAANGINSGGTIRGPHLPGEVKIPATSFRFKADGSALEPTSGSASGFGLAIDDWGDRFLVTNQQHALFVAPLAYHYLARNPYYAAPNLVLNISSYGHPARVYPTSQPDPWRLARSQDPAWVKFYGAAEATANGFFTAASGQAIYRADAFPPEFWGNHFSVDNAQNMVHRCVLEPQGVIYQARRPQADETTEFLMTAEQWFRPVNLTTGPDGALYVVDMYRAIIEDYSAIPRYLQQLYIQSLIAGSDRGRIWKIVADRAPPPRKMALAEATADELVAALASPNACWRETAQRLLVERGERSVEKQLIELATAGGTPQARLHALYTLDGLSALTPQTVRQALGDGHFAVRTHALVLSERWLQQDTGLFQTVAALADDPHPRVRLQAALTLGQSRSPAAAAALAKLAAASEGDAWLQASILSSAAETAADLMVEVVRRAERGGSVPSLLRSLVSIVGARHRNDEIGRALAAIGAVQGTVAAELQSACLAGLAEGLNRGKPEVLTNADGQRSLRALLANSDGDVRQLAFQVAKLVRLQEAPEMKAALEAAAKTALDDDRPLAERVAAVALWKGAPFDELAAVAAKLLEPRQPLDVQLAAVEALATAEDVRAADLLLRDWLSKTPKVQTAALDAIFQRQNRLAKLLDAVQQGAVPWYSLDAARREQLQDNSDAEIRRRARDLLATQGVAKDRQEVLGRYTEALTLPRDAGRGDVVFQRQCAKCHRVKEQGYVVGPDLANTIQRTDEMLVSDVLDPSNQLTAGYNSYTVVTEDGRIYTGVLAAESATHVTLRREEGKEDTILRKDIDEMAASRTSLMPEKVEQEIKPQEMVDLVAYLRQAFGPQLPAQVLLFDDDPAFADLLHEGEGRATLETADRFAGQASLRMSPPQRFSLQIPGWQYRIVERPAPGEYRYLRFAWKSCGGTGVMIELAGDGQWPPADKPLWRYYSGRNTTGWAARQAAADAPQQWAEVTCDLWKDFGPFTLTGLAPTALGGDALFDRIELLRELPPATPTP